MKHDSTTEKPLDPVAEHRAAENAREQRVKDAELQVETRMAKAKMRRLIDGRHID